MLFNSYIFIFIFLPVVLLVFYQLGGSGKQVVAISWLVVASLFFYAWWNPVYVTILLSSILTNYTFATLLSKNKKIETEMFRYKAILIVGILFNLSALSYFKYANFFVDNANVILGNSFHLDTIILPLAISFFTFQQITYLVDSYRGLVKKNSFVHYCLFVTFFPQLIAGPIVHYKEMLPQFLKDSAARFSHKYLAIGLSIFVIGLFKKVIIADNIALYSTPVFDAAAQGATISFIEAWGGALSYTFQLYFDFSGYADMAVGLAYMFGIHLALNFHSPYKANNIIDFWRKWHITLSRFLREYLYIPLGGNRNGTFRRYLNLMLVMLIGGLWHGAGWTFIIWGALHGFYLVINYLWRAIKAQAGWGSSEGWVWVFSSRIITFVAIVVAWVVFRADNMPAALEVLKGMSGSNGIIFPPAYLEYANKVFSSGDWLQSVGVIFENNVPLFGGLLQIVFLGSLIFIVWCFPNTHQIFHKHSPFLDTTNVVRTDDSGQRIKWQARPSIAIGIIIMFFGVLFSMDSTSEFLYFQF